MSLREFHERLGPATEWEKKLEAILRGRGCHAEPFGQALLSPEMREHLRCYEDDNGQPTLLRWIPDIIVARRRADKRSNVALIDAKRASSHTVNHSIEISALAAMEIYDGPLRTPAVFLFSDMTVLTPQDVRRRGREGPRPRPGYGSGTPYLLVKKADARPLEDFIDALLGDNGASGFAVDVLGSVA